MALQQFREYPLGCAGLAQVDFDQSTQMDNAVHIDAGAVKTQNTGAAVHEHDLHHDRGLIRQPNIQGAGYIRAYVGWLPIRH